MNHSNLVCRLSIDFLASTIKWSYFTVICIVFFKWWLNCDFDMEKSWNLSANLSIASSTKSWGSAVTNLLILPFDFFVRYLPILFVGLLPSFGNTRVDHEIFCEVDDISFLLRTFYHFIYQFFSLFVRIQTHIDYTLHGLIINYSLFRLS